MRPGYDAPVFNPLPWIVWVLALPVIAVELVFAVGKSGLVGGAQGIGWRQRQCCRQKCLNLDLAIDVGLCPPCRRHSVARWHFRQRIEMAEVLGKAAHINQSN